MYGNFNLTLMVNHACNLRCDYCYTGKKVFRSMPEPIGKHGIDRALASIKRGGRLELGFFGGEPMLEAELVARLIDYARLHCELADVHLSVGITTNGTMTTPAAWSIMTAPEVNLAVSHDGLPEVHNAHRRSAKGEETSELVIATMRGLAEAGKEFSAVMVVRPDTVGSLPEGVRFLHNLGVRHTDPTLDLWEDWLPDDLQRLEKAIMRLAHIWRAGLPGHSITWFDEKAARLLRLPMGQTARCGFGCGQVAIAPSGNLYPCERLIGEDQNDNPMRLPGHARAGDNFLQFPPSPARRAAACDTCEIRSLCSTTCRCSNYLRTGRVDRPDILLCLLNKVCVRETARILLREVALASAGARKTTAHAPAAAKRRHRHSAAVV